MLEIRELLFENCFRVRVEPLHPKILALFQASPVFYCSVCIQYIWKSGSFISVYYTECKPENKKTGETWERGYSNSTVKLIIVLSLVWLHRAMNCTQVYRTIAYRWLHEIYVQHVRGSYKSLQNSDCVVFMRRSTERKLLQSPVWSQSTQHSYTTDNENCVCM